MLLLWNMNWVKAQTNQNGIPGSKQKQNKQQGQIRDVLEGTLSKPFKNFTWDTKLHVFSTSRGRQYHFGSKDKMVAQSLRQDHYRLLTIHVELF